MVKIWPIVINNTNRGGLMLAASIKLPRGRVGDECP